MFETLEQYNYIILFIFFENFFYFFINIWYNKVDGDYMIKEKNRDLRNMFIGFGVILLYLILSSIPYDVISWFGVNYNKLNILAKTIYLVLYEIILTLIIIYIYRNDFIPNIKDFIKNNINYFKKYIKYWFLMLLLMIVSNLVITMFTTTNISQNQSTIIENLKIAPIYTFIVSVIVAPFLEELVFRLSFRKIFAHTNTLFIFFSGFIFGSMHVIGNFSNLIDLLFIIPYSIPGFIFAYVYAKSNNICVPISLHFIHNGIMMSLQILLYILM